MDLEEEFKIKQKNIQYDEILNEAIPGSLL